MIVGSSMGGIVGSLWAIGRDAEAIEKIAREFEHPLSKFKLLDPPIVPVSGLVRGYAIRKWLKKHFGNRTFYNVRTPLKVVAYDLIRREEIVMDGGPIVEALAKSVAIPGVIRPAQDKDQLIIDGGVLNPLPTNVLSSRGIKKIIAVNVLQSPEDVSQGFDITKSQIKSKQAVLFRRAPMRFLKFRIAQAFFKLFEPNISDIIIQTLQASGYVISEQNAQLADIVIHPDLVGIKWYQLDKVTDLIQRGEEATRAQLPAIKKLIED
jgi:NTE family protein